jgi:uncharacterized RDD family membrane protein YckC
METSIFCSKCGATNLATSQFCQKCGTAMTPAAIPVGYAAVAPLGITGQRYGGFWIRFLAIIIDTIVVRVALIPVFLLMGFNFVGFHRIHGRMEPEDVSWIVGVASTAAAITFCASWLYEAILTSSSWQATVGKQLFNLKVTDEAGNRISFARATGRYFAKIVSVCTLWIGFIMAAFTDRKRALHDMIAGTLVIKN